jgi:hypothetical protein
VALEEDVPDTVVVIETRREESAGGAGRTRIGIAPS